jgi:protein required for attachment to host cells
MAHPTHTRKGKVMKIENGTLVMVLDGAKLLLFRNDGDAKYPVLTTLMHEEAPDPPSRELGSDARGKVQSGMGVTGSSYDETDWHAQLEDQFVRHGAGVLEKTAGGQPDAGIVVVAPPRALGELRKHYGRATSRQLIGEIDKDLAGHVTDDIVEVIAAYSP